MFRRICKKSYTDIKLVSVHNVSKRVHQYNIDDIITTGNNVDLLLDITLVKCDVQKILEHKIMESHINSRLLQYLDNASHHIALRGIIVLYQDDIGALHMVTHVANHTRNKYNECRYFINNVAISILRLVKHIG